MQSTPGRAPASPLGDRTLRHTILLLALGFGSVACQGDKAELELETPTVTVSDVIPTVATVRWHTATPSVGTVEFGLPGETAMVTPTETEYTTEHELVLFGMKAGETYEIRASAVAENGTRFEMGETSVTLEPPPSGLPRITISEYDPAATAPGGYVLTSLIQPTGSWIVIIDRDGDYVWYWQVEDGLSSGGARFDARTHSLYFMQVDILGLTDAGEVTRIALDGSEIVQTRALLGHHDAVLHADGTVGFPSFDFRGAKVGEQDLQVVSDMVLEAAEGSDDSVLPEKKFAILDKIMAYAYCEHFWEEMFSTGAYDFSHVNSLMYDEARDQYMLLARNLDAILLVDRASGEIVERVGGDDPTITTEDPADLWSHPHMSHAWEGGFMVFDNGFHYEPRQSRIAEYALDQDAGTLELVWEFTDEETFFNPVFGDAQKLGDTYLGSWTEYGRLQEITSDGTVVWRAETDIGTAIGRSIWTDDLYDLSDVWTF